MLWVLIAILIWLPLPFASNQPMYWFYGQVALQLLTVWVVCSLVWGHLDLSRVFRKSWLPLGLFAGFMAYLCVLSFVPGFHESADANATSQQLVKSLCLLQVFCLTLLLVRDEKGFKLLVWALLISGTFQAVYGTLMTVTGTEYIWGFAKEAYRGVATGTFINRNHLAGYLEMTLALGIGLMIASFDEGRSRTWRQFFRSWTETLLGEKARIRICLVLMVIGLILTRSRMGNVAFFVGMGVAGLIGIFLFRKSQPAVVALFVSILIVDIFLLGTFFGFDQIQERLTETDVEAELRFDALQIGITEILPLSPWLGHGFGAFYTVFPPFRTAEFAGFLKHAHGDVVEFPIEVGLLGSVILLLLFASTLYMAIRVQLLRRNRFYRAMGFASTMAMVSIALHSTVDFNLQIFANASTFVCILAMPWVAMHLERGAVNARRKHS